MYIKLQFICWHYYITGVIFDVWYLELKLIHNVSLFGFRFHADVLLHKKDLRECSTVFAFFFTESNKRHLPDLLHALSNGKE